EAPQAGRLEGELAFGGRNDADIGPAALPALVLLVLPGILRQGDRLRLGRRRGVRLRRLPLRLDRLLQALVAVAVSLEGERAAPLEVLRVDDLAAGVAGRGQRHKAVAAVGAAQEHHGAVLVEVRRGQRLGASPAGGGADVAHGYIYCK